MAIFLESLTFLHTGVLAALLLLPALWYLLKATPPPPRTLVFPAARFLKDLRSSDQVPHRTPWWLLFIRCLLVACLILALAHPILNPTEQTPSREDIRIVIDNGWSSAQHWEKRIAYAENLVLQASRTNRSVTIVTTAHDPGSKQIYLSEPLSKEQALATLRSLEPRPWSAQDSFVAKFLKDNAPSSPIHSYWLGDGFKRKGFDTLATILQAHGRLSYILPEPDSLPLILRTPQSLQTQKNSSKAPTNAIGSITVELHGPPNFPQNVPIALHIKAHNGQILNHKIVTPNANDFPIPVSFDMPRDVMQRAASIEIASPYQSASSTVLIDENLKVVHIGLITDFESSELASLNKPSHYLQNALGGNNAVSTGSIHQVLEENPSMIVLPDTSALAPQTLEKLEQWLKDGGLLLRFAGPLMAQTQSFLVPVPLRQSKRVLEGPLTWGTPQSLAEFPEGSPFYGTPVKDIISVRQQVLPDPTRETSHMVWAQLQDGTPLITASSLEDGLLVLVHTTATPEWSDLALSGTYITILQKLAKLSAKPSKALSFSHALQPIHVLDGFGNFIDAKKAKPILAKDFVSIVPDQYHPPGLYGESTQTRALNLGGRLTPSKFDYIEKLPANIELLSYGDKKEVDLLPYMLSAAFLLFLLDWILVLFIRAPLRIKRSPQAITPALCLAMISLCMAIALSPSKTSAQNTSDIEKATGLHLAYIETANAFVNQTTQKGLEALSIALQQRTFVEPKGVVALNPETDPLFFYPLIYWPITSDAHQLSYRSLLAIQNYLHHGGTILFDTRDQHNRPKNNNMFFATQNVQSLRRTIGSLNIPLLIPISQDHVLTKTFYLMQEFPGKFTGGDIWVEKTSAAGRDGVSSVIIGSHDWASAWAAQDNITNSPYTSSQQRELALRFGINVMMYALTGNYKADQVHLPHILRRMEH